MAISSDINNELDQYGVWVKTPPHNAHDDDAQPNENNGADNNFDIELDLPDFSDLDKETPASEEQPVAETTANTEPSSDLSDFADLNADFSSLSDLPDLPDFDSSKISEESSFEIPSASFEEKSEVPDPSEDVFESTNDFATEIPTEFEETTAKVTEDTSEDSNETEDASLSENFLDSLEDGEISLDEFITEEELNAAAPDVEENDSNESEPVQEEPAVEENVSSEEKDSTSESFDLNSFEDGEISLDAFISSDELAEAESRIEGARGEGQEGILEGTVFAPSSSDNFAPDGEISLDAFLDSSDFSDAAPVATTEVENSTEDAPLDIDLSFDDNYAVETVEEEDESSELIENTASGQQMLETESVDFSEFITDSTSDSEPRDTASALDTSSSFDVSEFDSFLDDLNNTPSEKDETNGVDFESSTQATSVPSETESINLSEFGIEETKPQSSNLTVSDYEMNVDIDDDSDFKDTAVEASNFSNEESISLSRDSEDEATNFEETRSESVDDSFDLDDLLNNIQDENGNTVTFGDSDVKIESVPQEEKKVSSIGDFTEDKSITEEIFNSIMNEGVPSAEEEQSDVSDSNEESIIVDEAPVSDEAFSIDESFTVEENNLSVEEPAAIEESFTIEENTPSVEELAAIENSFTVEEPAASEDSFTVEENTSSVEEPAAFEDSFTVEENTSSVEEPAASEDSFTVEENTPSVEEPAAFEDSFTVEENNLSVEEPTAIEDSFTAEENTPSVEEPAAFDDSFTVEENTPSVEEPAAFDENFAFEETSVESGEEVFAESEPIISEEPVAEETSSEPEENTFDSAFDLNADAFEIETTDTPLSNEDFPNDSTPDMEDAPVAENAFTTAETISPESDTEIEDAAAESLATSEVEESEENEIDTSDIPDTFEEEAASLSEGFAEEPEASSEDMSAAILKQIVGELSSLKSEISSIKAEFANFKKNGAPENASEGFFAGEEIDNQPSLSSNEMDELMETISDASAPGVSPVISPVYAEEETEESSIDFEATEAKPEGVLDDNDLSSVQPSILEHLQENEKDYFPQDIPTPLTDKTFDFLSTEVEDEEMKKLDNIGFESEAEPAAATEEDEAAYSDDEEDETLEVGISEEPVSQVFGSWNANEGAEAENSVETVEPSVEESLSFTNSSTEEVPSFAETTTEEETETLTEEIPAFTETVADEATESTEALNEDVAFEGLETEEEKVPTVEDLLESPIEEPEPAPVSHSEAPATASSEAIPNDMKEEIKSVLSYMDQLLENLPEEKIAEFAQSEQFETYKKLFIELGLA